MTDFYRENHQAYHLRTFHLDPTSFLMPLIKVLPRGSTVLDVGCGSGRDLLWLKQRGYTVMGLERAHELADLAEQSVDCRVIRADFAKFDFTTLEVDAILLVGALVHLPHRKMPAVLKNISRALLPGGWMLMTLKEGKGKIKGADGREFYLWRQKDLSPLFCQSAVEEKFHSSQPSITGADDIWLTNLLRRPMVA